MKLSIIVACSENRVIGKNNQLPWSLPDDLRRFRAVTSGYPVIMGRKTFESIGKPLPNRENIVITRQKDLTLPGVRTCTSLEEAIESCSSKETAFVIGGAEIYRLALPLADRLYITRVEGSVEGDAFFPEWDENEYVLADEESHPVDERHAKAFSFLVFDRKNH